MDRKCETFERRLLQVKVGPERRTRWTRWTGGPRRKCRLATGRAPAFLFSHASRGCVSASEARTLCANKCACVRALGAIMCAWHCLQTLLLPSIGSPFSFTACALQV